MRDGVEDALLLTLAGAATAHARTYDLLRLTAATCHENGIGVERIAAVLRTDHAEAQQLIDAHRGNDAGPPSQLTL